MTLTAAADGSSLGNPGPMGWCWSVDEECWGAGGARSGTNNIGELLAVAELLDATAQSGHAGEPLRVLCDSQYVINSVTKWMHGWKRKGWKKADGKPVLNRDILERIDASLEGREVTFEWVKGHAGHPENEAADERARAAAEAYQAGKQPNTGPGFRGAPDTTEPPRNDANASDVEEAEVVARELHDPHLAPESPQRLLCDLEAALWGQGPTPAVTASRREELLHDEASGVDVHGSLLARHELIEHFASVVGRDDLLAGVASMVAVQVAAIAANTCLVTGRIELVDGTVQRTSSLWVYERLVQNERTWQLRHHHATLVSDGSFA